MLRARTIINTQDKELVVQSKDQGGRIRLYVRLGEDGMGYNTSRASTLRLTRFETTKLIKALQGALADAE